MIVRLDKAGQREERRKLLQGKADVVYAICHDALKGLQKEGRTAMSAVEVFLSARSFVSTMPTSMAVNRARGSVQRGARACSGFPIDAEMRMARTGTKSMGM